MNEINLVAVLTAIVLNQAIGFVWYSPLLFGRIWLKTADENCKRQRHVQRSATLQFLSHVFIVFILAGLIAWLGINTLSHGLLFTSLIALIIILTQLADSSLEEYPMINLMLQTGYRVATLFVATTTLLLF